MGRLGQASVRIKVQVTFRDVQMLLVYRGSFVQSRNFTMREDQAGCVCAYVCVRMCVCVCVCVCVCARARA